MGPWSKILNATVDDPLMNLERLLLMHYWPNQARSVKSEVSLNTKTIVTQKEIYALLTENIQLPGRGKNNVL